MNMVQFVHSSLIDFTRILFTFENINFYKSNYYVVHLPKIKSDVNKRIMNQKLNKDDIYYLMEVVQSKYDKYKKTYYKVKSNLNSHWKKVEEKGIYSKIEKLTQQKLPQQITCYLSIWGSGGTEIPPDKIVVRIYTPKTYKSTIEKSIAREPYTTSVGFELIELALNQYQKKYHIDQNKYIRIVDLILNETGCFYSGVYLRGDRSIDEKYYKYKNNIEALFKTFH